MSKKRAVELEKAMERVKRLKAKMVREKKLFDRYLRDELGDYLMSLFWRIVEVRFTGSDKNRITVVFENRCELRIPPPNVGEVPRVFVDNLYCASLYNSETGWYLESTTTTDAQLLHRLMTLAEVLPKARCIVDEVLPAWRANPPDAESLMTMRVLHWIAEQFGSLPLAVVMEEVLIKMVF